MILTINFAEVTQASLDSSLYLMGFSHFLKDLSRLSRD